MSKEINREEVIIDNKKIDHVYSAQFTQDPTKQENTDIQKNIDLYYTDLDIQDDNQLFIDPSGAKIKADNLQHKFPNHIVKFFMFYYEDTGATTSDGRVIVKKQLCQVVPGHSWSDEKHRYRNVRRKDLKSIYDKVDFIMIYRPKNSIKWYEVSREQLNEELAVIKSFYGLNNFPDKVGNFYFSKKIGKWLVSTELTDLIQWYIDNKQEIPVIYPDEIQGNGGIPKANKTIWEIIWDWIIGAFQDMGTLIGNILHDLFDPDAWAAFWADENNNYVPDNLEEFWNRIFQWRNPDDGKGIFDTTLLDIIGGEGNIKERINALRRKIGSSGNLDTRLNNLINELNNHNFGLGNIDILQGIKDKFKQTKNDIDSQASTGWFKDVFSQFKSWVLSTLGIDL